MTTNLPGHYGNAQYDLTGHIGPMFPEITAKAEWPMYSFDRPAHIVWNAIAKQLNAAGWSDHKIKEWLQSKSTRYALDGALGEALEAIGTEYGKRIAGEANP